MRKFKHKDSGVIDVHFQIIFHIYDVSYLNTLANVAEFKLVIHLAHVCVCLYRGSCYWSLRWWQRGALRTDRRSSASGSTKSTGCSMTGSSTRRTAKCSSRWSRYRWFLIKREELLINAINESLASKIYYHPMKYKTAEFENYKESAICKMNYRRWFERFRKWEQCVEQKLNDILFSLFICFSLWMHIII